MNDERLKSVFVNCPFDKQYRKLFEAIAFTILFCGFNVRSALEETSSGDVRLHKILRLIKESRFSVHDLSRVELDNSSGLPRFNMPLELGASIGLYHTATGIENHSLLILDTEKFRYQKYVSDLGGVDIASHGNRSRGVIRAVSDFLTPFADDHVASPSVIQKVFRLYEQTLPALAAAQSQRLGELRYIDRTRHMVAFLAKYR